ncbi:MAG TPA: condensation domain-containing protein, partial [Thermoanaerobaculia bacterium]|nr:condensation domain-containing protein [Thermoanaerobaculia bacterium]
PTEATIVCTAWPVPSSSSPDRTLIGHPLEGVETLVADRYGEPVLLGAPGELWIGGSGVARGYLHRDELTAERFVEKEGRRWYRTGDLVRQLPGRGGVLEFLGRTDQQVKVRGFRVEPGEIETILVSHPRIREAVVAARDAGQGDRRLVAWYVPAGEDPGAAAVRDFLAARLPGYMVPSLFAALPELPLTTHGKVDRDRLPEPEAATAATVDGPHEAPRTPAEELVAGVWSEILGVPSVGRTADFFDLGGHSLLATRVVTRLREGLGIDLLVRSLFQAPTVEALARELEALLAAGDGETAPPIVPVPREGDLPLSFAQERLWLVERLTPGTAAYNIPLALEVEGAASPAALEAALGEMVRRHEVLRTTYEEHERLPVQRIAPAAPWTLPLVDFSGLPAASREKEARLLAEEEVSRPFDLEQGPVLRTTLLRLGADRHALLLNVHHIAADGWSLEVMLAEIAALYQGETLPEVPVQYADFAVWQRRWLSGDALERQLAYWRDRLRSSPALDLPTDRPRPAQQSFRGATLDVPLPPEALLGLQELARRQDATLFMVVLAVFQTLLSRYTGQDDIVLGSPIANRNRSEVEPLIGFFVNTLVLRGDLAGDPPFTELVARARQTALEAYGHQDLPFGRLVEELRPERRLSHNPLFQVMVGVQNAPAGRVELPGLSFAAADFDLAVTRFDLEAMIWETGEAPVAQLTWATDLFDAVTVGRMARHLETLLAGLIEDPERRLSDLPLLGFPERHQLLREWNDTAADLPEVTLVDLFREQAARRPGAVAVSSAEGDLTYADLDIRSDRLARRLAAAGV